MNRLFKTLFITIFFSFSCFGTQIIEGGENYIAQLIEVHGDVLVKESEKGSTSWTPVSLGLGLSSSFALKTLEKSYVKILLADNSIIQLSETTGIKIDIGEGKSPKLSISIARGKMRMLSYQNSKVINTPWGDSEFEKGEFQWDVFNENQKLKVVLTAYSGSLKFDGEIIEPSNYAQVPESKESLSNVFNRPYYYWFGNDGSIVRDYDIAFDPSFKKATRGIASKSEEEIEDVIVEDEIEVESFDKVKGAIWVHDIVYDEAVRTLELASYEKARELVPVAVEEASNNLVWDVASRSVLKWGVQYAKDKSRRQVPLAVAGSYMGEREDQFNYYDKDSYRKSTEDIAYLRAYRAAKVSMMTVGYEKGWKEAEAYTRKMLPIIVKPLIMQEVFDYAYPKGKQAIQNIIDKSELTKTKDVDKLVLHLAQVISEKTTADLIEKYGKVLAKRAAQNAAKEAAKSSSEEVARYMAENSGKKAGELITQLLARERGRSIARKIASEAKIDESEEAKKEADSWQFRSQR